MSQQKWSQVDRYFAEHLAPSDPVLEAVLQANAEADLPAHDVAPNQGKLLYLLARAHRARAILEIGTLGGYSTVWLARALPPEGRLVTLERDPKCAEVARRNFKNAGVDDVVDVRVGPALQTLPILESEQQGPFDLIFIDADKPNNPEYLSWALALSREGSLIIGG